MRFIKSCLLIAFLLLPATVRAEWWEASSANFIVYADDNEKEIRRFTEQLELYHSAMEMLTGTDLAEPSPSSRLTVFAVRNNREVRNLYGEVRSAVAGFYIPRASGSIAVVPNVRAAGRETEMAMIVLLHEYAHHFLASGSAFPMPRWMSEGAAEFFASAKFPSDGGIWLGLAAQHRASELANALNVTAAELVDPAANRDATRKGVDSFYGRSWLLYHYLTFEPSRRGQLLAYTQLLASGKSSPEAAAEVFGDLRELDRDMNRYIDQRRLLSVRLKPEHLETSPVTMRKLREGEAAVLPLVIRSRRGVSPEQAAELVPEIRQVAAAYPDDPAVFAALAEAEFDAGEDERAIAAADRALALNPRQVNAYVQKGYALFRQAADAPEPEAAYKAAVEPFVALNRIENNHPLPLQYYFLSFVERGEPPNDLAVRGLERAVQLAPFDRGLRHTLATHLVRTERLDRARAHLLPLAYNAHGGAMAEAARQAIELIDQGGENAPSTEALLALLTGASTDTEEAE